MLRSRFSMRASLVLTILAMGLLGMLLTYLSGEVYRHLTLDTQRATLTEYLRAESNKMREDFEFRTRSLAQYAQGDAGFAKAIAGRQSPLLVRQLDNLYQYGLVGSEEVRVNRLYLLDQKLGLMATSSIGDENLTNPPCFELLARMTPVPERSRSTYRLCFVGDRPYYVAIAPLMFQGGGYLYFAGELAPGLIGLEHELSAPVRLRLTDGTAIYQSPDWPEPEQLALRVVANYPIHASAPKPISLELELAKDMTTFYERLTNLRYLVLLSVAIVTALAMFMALFALERTALKPLRVLMAHLQRLRQDPHNLGEQLNVSGNIEVSALAQGCNEMTARLRELYESLERIASTDALTGLPNRDLFRDRLQQAILSAKREAKPFALLIMDLDRFKDVNDTLGHKTGDLLLVQVAQRLRAKLRCSDTVARMGGDEFAVLLPAADAKHAGMASRMLLQALRAAFTVEEHNLNVGASIGIALYPENGVDTNVLMQRADVAMYAAKGSGTGYAFYNPTADQNYPTRLTLLSDLRQAIEQEQFELYFQPIVNLRSSKVTGIEALARWRHPRDGILLPDSFIPLLEQSGLIRGLMPWVVSEALKRAHALQLAGSPLTVSINLSMCDLQDPYIVESFAEQLEAHQVAADSIVLEITESAVMTDAPRTRELLLKLAGMGLKIAVDDFGTGYSSLTYLKKLPVSTLKIDKSFVIGMTSDENDAAIVRTSIDLAHNLGLKAVAEGVESEAVLKQLKALGCDLAQGHYLGRPLTQTELEDWLAHSAWGFGATTKATREQKRMHS
jgi:diguanylate cyclase (GGDEF)-like protein